MENEIITQEKPNLRTIMRSDEVRSRFIEVLGESGANGYISSVLIAVAGNENLQKCSANSIIGSALRAANMRLSVDPATPQAYLVPYKNKATMVVGYHGLYQMAIRTGKYRYLNVAEVYESDKLTEDPLTGLHNLERNDLPVHLGKDQKQPNKIIGYLLYFRLIDGFEKTFYMTNKQCDQHGKQYAPSYNFQNSLWKTNPQVMYWKTVLRLGLMKWGYLDPMDRASLESEDEIFDDSPVSEFIEGGVSVEAEPYSGDMSNDEIIEIFGYETGDDNRQMAPEKPVKKQPKASRPLSPEDLKAMIEKKAGIYGERIASQQQRGLMVAMLEACYAGDGADMKRHEVLQYLTGQASSKDMRGQYVIALLDWLKPEQDDGGQYKPDPMAAREAQTLLTVARKDAGQMELENAG